MRSFNNLRILNEDYAIGICLLLISTYGNLEYEIRSSYTILFRVLGT